MASLGNSQYGFRMMRPSPNPGCVQVSRETAFWVGCGGGWGWIPPPLWDKGEEKVVVSFLGFLHANLKAQL